MDLGLPSLLSAAWLAGTLPIVVASLPFSFLRPLRDAVLCFARRGKTMPSSSSNKFTVPQRFFLHFYLVAVVWTAFLLLLTWFYAYRMMESVASKSFHYPTVASHLTGGSHIFSFPKSHTAAMDQQHHVWTVVFLLLLMEVQVLRRLYETLHVFNYSPSARMHIFGYLTGLFFYTAAPLSLSSSCAPEVFKYAASQAAEYTIKGRVHMSGSVFDWRLYVKPLAKLGWLQWCGAAIFFWGWIHQFRCHAILGSLREHKRQADEYAIPHGDWFEIVSCAHYLAEIVFPMLLPFKVFLTFY